MTEEEARMKTIDILGEDSFTERDTDPVSFCFRYYVGACPTRTGIYRGAMGFSWEEALEIAAKELK